MTARADYPTLSRVADRGLTGQTAAVELVNALDRIDNQDDLIVMLSERVGYFKALYLDLKASLTPAPPRAVEKGEGVSPAVSPPDTAGGLPHDGPWLYRCDECGSHQ